MEAIYLSGAEVFVSGQLRKTEVLLLGNKILSTGPIETSHLGKLGITVTSIDARDCYVLPGLIDGHQHYLGGSGEKGFRAQTAEVTLSEQIRGGITTSVGCLGVDTCTRTMHALLGRSKVFNDENHTSFIYSGGYRVPSVTLTGSIDSDMVLCNEVIGAGELAIADSRSSYPSPHEVARIVSQAHNGGILTRKAGITHFHVGPNVERLKMLRTLINDFEISPTSLYPTHLSRSPELMKEGIDFVNIGGMIDLDVQDKDLMKWLKFYLDHNGKPGSITASSDASIVRPETLFMQVRECILEGGLPVEIVLPLVTENPARALKFHRKAKIEAGFDADVIIVEKKDFILRDVISSGEIMMQNCKIMRSFHSEAPKNL